VLVEINLFDKRKYSESEVATKPPNFHLNEDFVIYQNTSDTLNKNIGDDFYPKTPLLKEL
jgi:hypothetical protein